MPGIASIGTACASSPSGKEQNAPSCDDAHSSTSAPSRPPSSAGHAAPIVDAALTIAHADAATVQLVDADNVLELLSAKGLPMTLVKRFGRVDAKAGTSSEAALRTGKRVSADYQAGTRHTAESDRAYLEAGFRCAQSTPLISRGGTPIGMITTHWSAPHASSG